MPCRAVGEDEPHDPRSQKVAILTMHASKGREFSVVMVAGVEKGLLPLDIEGFQTDPQEEKRLLYVAITRARHLAVLPFRARRVLFGKSRPGGPSVFLNGVPEDAVVRVKVSAPKRKARQLTLF